MAGEKCAVSIERIVKRFGKFEALKGVSLCVQEGEIFGLLGPNGAGKTTLLSIISTIMQASSGKASVNGFDVRERPDDVRKSIGMVFQENSLDIDLTARENLWFHARMFQLPDEKIPEKSKEALRLADLEEFADKEIKKFSGGMKRRLEIFRALMHEPKVLFLDEPTLGLDAQTRRKLWEKIRELNQKGMTIILTTHYMEEADELCDRIAIIDHGKIIALDSGEELKKKLKGDSIILETTNNEAFAKKLPKFVKSAKIHDSQLSITLEHAEKHIEQLVLAARKNKISIKSMTVQKPSLEDVFLSFTGKTIREAELDEGEQFSERAKAIRQGLRR